LSFKCSGEDFAELSERNGIRPAPYLARAQWVALDVPDALTPAELKQQLRRAYEIVLAKLPKKQQAALARKKRA
jgi:predicted DNA-binding protein (MmcQ/YjbR family)